MPRIKLPQTGYRQESARRSGLGLKIITTFHLFKYKEPAAPIIVMVAALFSGEAYLRGRFPGEEQ